jgi:hypothetical protein
MQIRHPLLVLLFITGSLAAFAQKADEASKEKEKRTAELIEQIVAELPNLTLAENRAIVSAKVGNLLWKSDPERARGLFLQAGNELINAQAQAEIVQKRSGVQSDLLAGGQTRTQVLNMLSDHDAELALELLAKTRPPMLLKALSEPKNAGKIDNYGNLAYLRENENNLEQSFIRKAADQNPARMVKLLKDALAKNISHQSLNLLKKLHEKDPTSAKEIAGQIVDKLLAAKLTVNDQATNLATQNAINFLSDFIQPHNQTDKSFRFDESQMRALTDKLVSFYLANTNGAYFNYSIVPIAEKLAPGKVEQLKVLPQNRNGRFGDGYNNPELQKLFTGTTSTADLLAAAKKFPAQNRPQIYQQAVSQLINQGHLEQAAAVINENYSGDALDDAMRNLNGQFANRLINEGRFAEAERLIDEQPETTRAYSLINLAVAIYNKDRVENKAYAAAVVGKVYAMLPERAENNSDMQKFMQVIMGYANIDSPEAVRIYEQMVPQINDLTEAAIVLSPFQGNSNVQKGEYVMTHGGIFGNFGFDYSVFSTFARKDLDQTIRLIDMFTRRETRIMLKMQMIESLR